MLFWNWVSSVFRLACMSTTRGPCVLMRKQVFNWKAAHARMFSERVNVPILYGWASCVRSGFTCRKEKVNGRYFYRQAGPPVCLQPGGDEQGFASLEPELGIP